MEAEAFVPFGGEEVGTLTLENADIAVLPLCYENCVSYGTGTVKGPFHLLRASAQLELMDEETLVNWGEKAIHTLAPLFPAEDPEQAVAQMKHAAAEVLRRNKFLLCLGGDHAISIGPILAVSEIHPGTGVLQIDAHADLRNEWNGSRFNHACVMRRVIEDAGLAAVQAGIRSFSPEEAEYMRQRRIRPFYAHEIDPSDDSWIGEILCALPEKVYLTIDVDGLDPAVIPGTGTPEPGGFSYRQIVRLIRALGREKKVVAADINELAKIQGSQVSEVTAARIAAKILVYCT
ncbi:MAG: agmatinase [Desulfobacterales bacterium]